MRALPLAAPLLLLSGIAAAEPSLAVRRANLGNINGLACMERARASIAAAGFRLAERSESLQIGASDDYVASIACVQGQPTVLIVNVAGPLNAEAQRLANAVRDGVLAVDRPPAPAQKQVR